MPKTELDGSSSCDTSSKLDSLQMAQPFPILYPRDLRFVKIEDARNALFNLCSDADF